MKHPSNKWKRKAEIYKEFAPKDCELDFSDEAALEMFQYETYGEGSLTEDLWNRKLPNGFAVGKKWLDITVTMWKQDLKNGVLPQKERELLAKYLNEGE